MGPEQLAVEDKKHLGPVQILRFPQVVKLVFQTIQGKNKHTISGWHINSIGTGLTQGVIFRKTERCFPLQLIQVPQQLEMVRLGSDYLFATIRLK